MNSIQSTAGGMSLPKTVTFKNQKFQKLPQKPTTPRVEKLQEIFFKVASRFEEDMDTLLQIREDLKTTPVRHQVDSKYLRCLESLRKSFHQHAGPFETPAQKKTAFIQWIEQEIDKGKQILAAREEKPSLADQFVMSIPLNATQLVMRRYILGTLAQVESEMSQGTAEEIQEEAKKRILADCDKSFAIQASQKEFLETLFEFLGENSFENEFRSIWQCIYVDLLMQKRNQNRSLSLENHLPALKAKGKELAAFFQKKVNEDPTKWGKFQEQTEDFIELIPQIIEDQIRAANHFLCEINKKPYLLELRKTEPIHSSLDSLLMKRQPALPSFDSFFQEIIAPPTEEALWLEYSPPLSLPHYVKQVTLVAWDFWQHWDGAPARRVSFDRVETRNYEVPTSEKAAPRLMKTLQRETDLIQKIFEQLDQLGDDLEKYNLAELIDEIRLNPEERPYLNFIQYTHKQFLGSLTKEEQADEDKTGDDAFFAWVNEQANVLEQKLLPFLQQPSLLGVPLQQMRMQEMKDQLSVMTIQEIDQTLLELGPQASSQEVLQKVKENLLKECQESRKVQVENADFLRNAIPSLHPLYPLWKAIHGELLAMQRESLPLSLDPSANGSRFIDKLPEIREALSQKALAYFREERSDWFLQNQVEATEFCQLFPAILDHQIKMISRSLRSLNRSHGLLTDDFEKFYEKSAKPLAYEVLWVEYSPPISLPDYLEAMIHLAWPLWTEWAPIPAQNSL